MEREVEREMERDYGESIYLQEMKADERLNIGTLHPTIGQLPIEDKEGGGVLQTCVCMHESFWR